MVKYLVVNLVFSHLGFWSGNLSLIATFPDLCLLVPFSPTLCNTETITHFTSECSLIFIYELNLTCIQS